MLSNRNYAVIEGVSCRDSCKGECPYADPSECDTAHRLILRELVLRKGYSVEKAGDMVHGRGKYAKPIVTPRLTLRRRSEAAAAC